MAKSREVKIAVVGDASQLQREMQKARASMGDFGAATDRAQSALGSFLIGGAAIVGAKKLVDAAAELEQAVGGTAAVFGSASDAVSEFSKNAAQLAGLSENAARTLTSRLGASLKGVGLSSEEAAKQSIFLAQTGADLAATLGGSAEEAVTALGAALRGEFDPLERFGIALKASDIAAKAVSMGLAENANDVSQYAKGQAALALITEKSAFAQGQFARESNTAAGAAAIARAESQNTAADLGRSLLPIYTKISEVVGAVASAFSALPGPVQTGVVAIAGIALVAKPATEAVRALSDIMRALPVVFDRTVESLFTFKGEVTAVGKTQETLARETPKVTSAFNSVTAALGAVGLAVTAAAVIWSIYSANQEEAKKRAKEFGDTLDESNGQITQNTIELVKNQLAESNRLDNLTRSGVSVAAYTRLIAAQNEEFRASTTLRAIAAANDKVSQEIRDRDAASIRAQGGALNEFIALLVEKGRLDEGILDQLEQNIDASLRTTEATRQQAEAQAIANGATEDGAKAAGDQAVAEKRNADALKATNDELRKKIDLLFEAATGQINLEQSGISARKAIEEFNKAQSDGSKSAVERREAELSAQEAILRVGQAAVKAAEDQKGSALTAAEAQAVQVFQLANLANSLAPGSPLRVYIEQYIAKLNEIPANKPTTVTADTSQATAELDNLRDRLLGIIRLSSAKLPSFVLPGRWSGGPVDENRPYVVGEKGPELFVPSSYGRIVDAFGTNKMMNASMGGTPMGGGNSYNITINTVTGNPLEIERVVIDAIARAYQRGTTSLRP
jgi:hypothetical protein